MSGKIYLTSGGYIEGQRGEKLDKIIEGSSGGKKVLIVDNATTTGSNLKGKGIVINDFSLIAEKVEVLTLTKDNLDEINNYDVIYLLGGDVTPLIELANNSNASEIIKTYVKNGGIIFGESAGSMIFGKDLKWIYDIKRGNIKNSKLLDKDNELIYNIVCYKKKSNFSPNPNKEKG